MNRNIPVALLVIGCVLLAFGVSSWDSFGSDVSQTVTGAPTTKAIVMVVAGTLFSIAGLTGVCRRSVGA